ncbi:SUMF1/EgtB/PvdO family nonheme iron enzyme, partial [Halomonas sp. BC04]|uniref:SUMF1/EgtB/PvdO family nonheme iron enzyme n=1 Tax=Halomonas sp. BC04 TaxID=1403540 RepID=UPI0012DF83BE
ANAASPGVTRRRRHAKPIWTAGVWHRGMSRHCPTRQCLRCRQMLGNVWEWTASPFGPFPGFEPELYRDYSAPWFKEGRYVLRGGAWATRGRLIHNSYRNFFTPERRDILAGFRTCAL